MQIGGKASELMARKSAEEGGGWTSVRVTEDALRLARIASGYEGVSLGDFLSRVLTEASNEAIERGHAALRKGEPKSGKGGAG